MPLIQTLFYFAGFTAFLLASLFFATLLMVALKNFKRFRIFLDKIEEKMDTPLITVLMPFLPTLIALFGELKRNRKR